jgi:glycosyltransferase involved in cell wall biosynthesis/GT2 family glycosyltransferase
MKVSIVINTYNRMHTLPMALDGIQRLRYPLIEVIVVNGPSTDGTGEYLRKNWADKIKILNCDEPNLSKSRNIGIMAVAGEIVAFIDDDAVPEPDWLDNIVPLYKDPCVGAVGGFVRDNSGVSFQAKYIHSGRDGFSNCQENGPVHNNTGNLFNGMIGVNSTFRRTALLEIGGFDEEYAYFLDETDVCARLIQSGYKIETSPTAEVHHKYAASHIRSEKGVPKTWQQIAKSAAYYCIMNKGENVKLTNSFDNVWKNYYNCLKSTDNARLNGLQGHEVTRLYAELRLATEQGIFDAFFQKSRKLISQANLVSAEWLGLDKLPGSESRIFRLAFVTDVYPPLPCGGVAVFIRALAEKLAACGHEITVITFTSPGRPHTVDFESGVWVHRLSIESEFENLNVPNMPDHPLRLSQIILAELNRINERRKFEWVISSVWDLPLGATIASGRYKVATYLVTSYALMLDTKLEWRSNRNYYENHVLKMIAVERWAIQNSNLVIGSTRAILRDSEKMYGIKVPEDRLAIVPFGLRNHQSKKTRKTEIIKLLFVGRFERRKGIHLLLEIIPVILEKYRNVEVDLVGDCNIAQPNEKSFWQEFQEKHVGASWLGKINAPGIVSEQVLEDYYEDCDIFIAPSLYESFGLVYIEAMRHGKPCIGSNIGGIPEVIIDGETGILVDPGSPSSLLLAIERLLLDPATRQKYGQNGRQRFVDNFTIDTFQDRFIGALVDYEKVNIGKRGCQ